MDSQIMMRLRGTLRRHFQARRHTALLVGIVTLFAVRPLMGDTQITAIASSFSVLVLMILALYTEWVVLSSAARGVTLVRNNAAVVVQRLALLLDVLIGAVILSGLLMTWQVYDSPAEAITGLLSVRATIGSQQITVGLVVLAVGALGVSYLASWMLQTLLTENVLARRNVETGVSIAVSRLLHYALVTIGFVIALVVLGVDLTKMTLLVSALGVGIGFGLQTIVNNFVCGLILLFERPLRVGDTIELSGQSVKISKIGLRATTVRTSAQADIIVPNTDLVTNQVTNWTLTDRHARGMIAVKVASGSDIARVMQTLKECALAHPGIMKNPEPQVLCRSFGDGALNFELSFRVAEVDNRSQIESDLQGKTTEAQQMLAEIYSWFTEGFDTKDLQEAKALLTQLASPDASKKRKDQARTSSRTS